MLIDNINDLFFSQLALTVYDKCKLKFRRRYIDGLFWPADWSGNKEQKEMVEKGRKFHLLAQRYFARGENIQKEYLTDELVQWFSRLKEFRPYNDVDIFKAEYDLRINKNTLKLVSKYDLLYIDERSNRFIIYDWKTNKKKLNANKLKDKLQTRVYLFVLKESIVNVFSKKNISYDDISIIYWNPRYPRQNNKITYTENMYKSDREFIKSKIKEIKSLSYDEFNAVSDEKTCKYCEYRPICHGKEAKEIDIEEDDIDLELDWDSVDEISF